MLFSSLLSLTSFLNNGLANKRLKLHSLVSDFIIGKIYLFVNDVNRRIQGNSTLSATFSDEFPDYKISLFINKLFSCGILTNVNIHNQYVIFLFFISLPFLSNFSTPYQCHAIEFSFPKCYTHHAYLCLNSKI